MKLLKNSFFRICAFLGILFASSIPVAAQGDEIYEVPGINSKKSIVRYWKGMEYIVYGEDNGKSFFSLVDVSSMTYTSFTSAYLGVKDFEIIDKTVYFCGHDGNNPIAGFFNIPTLFSSATGMYYSNLGALCNSTFMTSSQERITDLMKLAVQACPDGYHIYMVGKADFIPPYGPVVDNRCFVDMRWFGMTGVCCFVQEPTSVYYYDDVTITNNNVEVVGHKHGSSGYYNTSFSKPSSVVNPVFPSMGFYTANYHYAGGGGCYANDPNRPVMATHLFGDYYAMVNYADICKSGIYLNDRGTVLSIFNSSSTCAHRYYISQGYDDTANWKYKDLRFNAKTGKLYLLQDMSNPVCNTLNSVICEFDIDGTGAVTSIKAYYEPDVPYLSLDQYEYYFGAVTVGGVSGISPLRLWHHVMGSNCVIENGPPFIELTKDNSTCAFGQYPLSFQCNTYPVTGELNIFDLIKICE